MHPENPYEPPTVAEVAAPQLTDTSMELASLSERFLGAFIDSFIDGVLALILIFILIATGILKSVDDVANFGILSSFLITLPCFAFHIGINWKFLSTSGQTIGKKAAKIRVVTLDGHLPNMIDQVVKRYAIFVIIAEIPEVGLPLSLVNILFIFGRQRRCLHDFIAGTRVIKAHP